MKVALILFLIFFQNIDFLDNRQYFKELTTVLNDEVVTLSIEPFDTIKTSSQMSCCVPCIMNSEWDFFAFSTTTYIMYDGEYCTEEGFKLESTTGFVYYSVVKYWKMKINNAVNFHSTYLFKIPESVIKVYQDDPLIWKQAIKLCESKNRRLAYITSEEIQNEVIKAIEKVNAEGDIWVGMNAINFDDNFHWMNGIWFYDDEDHVDSKDPFYTWYPGMTVDYRSFEVAIVILGSDFESNAYKWTRENTALTFDRSVSKVV